MRYLAPSIRPLPTLDQARGPPLPGAHLKYKGGPPPSRLYGPAGSGVKRSCKQASPRRAYPRPRRTYPRPRPAYSIYYAPGRPP